MTRIDEQTTTTRATLAHTSPCYREARAKVPGHHFPDPWKVAGELIGDRTVLQVISRRDHAAGAVGSAQVEHWDNETAYAKDPSRANLLRMNESRDRLVGIKAEHDAWSRAVYIARGRREAAEKAQTQG